jgi:hypothetical protein
MVTLTMRHQRDALAACWEALSDAWAAATGRNSAARRAKQAAGVAGWVRRVEATWGPANGWHLHVHALLFVPGAATQADADKLGRAMFGAWAARLTRVGLTPIRDSGGLRAQLLDLDGARAEVGAYVTKGTYTGEGTADNAALELTGGGKRGRGENLTPWGLLDAAIAGNRRARAVWGEWEQASLGRRALTWSRGLRDELGLGEDVDDDALVDDVDAVADEVVAVWAGDDWAAIRDADAAVDLLEVAEAASPLLAGDAVRHFCRARGLPAPRGPDL